MPEFEPPENPMPPVFEIESPPAIHHLESLGYISGGDFHAQDVRLWSDGRYVVAKRLLFHWTVLECHLDDDTGYDDRWCCETLAIARTAVQSFPDDWPVGFEPVGWHHHPRTARRRDGGDPSNEEIDP